MTTQRSSSWLIPELEWMFLDPNEEHPKERVCHGREQLEYWMARQHDQGLRTVLEEIVGIDDTVMVGTRTPGVEMRRLWRGDDRSFHVLTPADGRMTKLRACRSRDDALALAGV